jgi:phosphatidate cytidylyltransferase
LNFPSLLCPYSQVQASKGCNFQFVEHFESFNVTFATLFTFKIYPIQIHALIMATFASLIAPFGGFFASGFKRANKMKDFAASIPGHGGVTDRMDCQLIMGLFSYLYIESFLKKEPIVDRLFDLVTRQLNRQQAGELVERLIRFYQQN